MTQELICVLDVGKTLTKLSAWDKNGKQIAKVSLPSAAINNNIETAPRIEWLAQNLREFTKLGHIKAIFPVAHGATFAAIRENKFGDNQLAFPIMDYEATIPTEIYDEYISKRGDFFETGSPLLPNGLNFGAQIYYAKQQYKAEFDGVTLMPFAQYWAWILSGVASSEVTSLGCHSDLWNPTLGEFSQFAQAEGIAAKFAPLRKAYEIIGNITPEWSQKTGLPHDTAIYCGIHDSNSALIAARGFAEIADNEATILSTGTWFVAMRTPKEAFDIHSLPLNRDCLVNVDAYGNLIPSARFMGGREIESHIKIDTRRIDIKPDQPKLLQSVAGIIENDIMALPCFAKGYGPFPDMDGKWLHEPRDWYETRAAISLYAALVANQSLNLIGAKNDILVEGRFAEAEVFIRALASLRPNDKIYAANESNDVSYGALRLINPKLSPDSKLRLIEPLAEDLSQYAEKWGKLLK